MKDETRTHWLQNFIGMYRQYFMVWYRVPGSNSTSTWGVDALHSFHSLFLQHYCHRLIKKLFLISLPYVTVTVILFRAYHCCIKRKTSLSSIIIYSCLVYQTTNYFITFLKLNRHTLQTYSTDKQPQLHFLLSNNTFSDFNVHFQFQS